MDVTSIPSRDIIVIGASAGGLAALTDLVRGLPEGLQAAIFIVVHTSPDNPSVLAQILDRVGPLPAGIVVSPDDRHLFVGVMGADYVEVVDWRARRSVAQATLYQPAFAGVWWWSRLRASP